MTHAERIARLRLIRTPHVGPVSWHQLMRRFGTAEAALDALPGLALRGGGGKPRIASTEIAEREMASRPWAAGDDFSMADCAAAPALFYAAKVLPYADSHPHLAAYLERLKARPSYARVLKEAEPYFHMFPQET